MQLLDSRCWLILVCFLWFQADSSAQVYLYLEDMTEVKAIKIPEGSTVSIKTTEEPKWTSYKIDRLLAEDKIILHENGLIPLSDITNIRIERKWVRALGTNLQRFGVAWTVYGAIVVIAGKAELDTRLVLIGAIPIAAGYLMKKMWLYKTYGIGKKNRLKILDLSFPDDPYGVKKKVIKP